MCYKAIIRDDSDLVTKKFKLFFCSHFRIFIFMNGKKNLRWTDIHVQHSNKEKRLCKLFRVDKMMLKSETIQTCHV